MSRINLHLECDLKAAQEVIGTVAAGLLLLPGVALAVVLLPVVLPCLVVGLLAASLLRLAR